MDEDDYERVGPRPALDRLLAEYALSEPELGDRIRDRTPPRWLSGHQPEPEYLVHRSVLRSHGPFPCAGDAEARDFCEQVADALVSRFGIGRAEAVARINRQWSEAEPPAPVPRVWIVGPDIVYHEEPAYWAVDIYYGPDSQWWRPGAAPVPLPPP
jgi:hypothetical protein